MLLGGVGYNSAWRIESTLFGLALHCGAALLFLKESRGPTLAMRALVPLVICSVNFLVLVVNTWWFAAEEKSWAQTGVLFAAGLLLTPTWTLVRKAVFRPLIATGLITTGAATALSLVLIWTSWRLPNRQTWDRATAVLWTLAMACSLIAALYAWKPVPRLRALRIAVTVIIAFTAALISTGIIDDSIWRDEFFGRLTIVFAILSVCGVLVNAILVRLLRPQANSPTSQSPIEIEMRCPKCREELLQPAGASACPHCRTKFEIRVIPVACIRCGYDISNLRQPTCPECGAAY